MAEDRFGLRVVKQRDKAILDSLLACFNEHGCFRMKLDQVVTDVGIGKGTLYGHYSSRGDLFKAALAAGIHALLARSQRLFQTKASHPASGFRELIREFVSLNQRGDPVSPATLVRLRCSCRWMNGSHPNDATLEGALIPLVRSWQTAGVLDKATDPSWIAAIMVALVGSPPVTNYSSDEVVEQSPASTSPRRAMPPAEIGDRIVEVLRRAFAPAADPSTEVP